jgi:hypothetical protein
MGVIFEALLDKFMWIPLGSIYYSKKLRQAVLAFVASFRATSAPLRTRFLNNKFLPEGFDEIIN